MYDYRKYQQSVLPFAKLLPLETDLLHASLGLVSEAGEIADALKAHMIYGKELDVLNLKEEAGDGLWFAQLAARLLNLDIQEICDGVGEVSGSKDRLISYALRAADAAAAISVRIDNFVVGSQPLPLPALAQELRRYLTQLARIGAAVGFTLGDAAEANVAKLTTRYKGKGFDPEHGLNRDTEAERVAMSFHDVAASNSAALAQTQAGATATPPATMVKTLKASKRP